MKTLQLRLITPVAILISAFLFVGYGNIALASRPSLTCDFSRVSESKITYDSRTRRIVPSHRNMCAAITRCEASVQSLERSNPRASVSGLNQVHFLQHQYGCRNS